MRRFDPVGACLGRFHGVPCPLTLHIEQAPSENTLSEPTPIPDRTIVAPPLQNIPEQGYSRLYRLHDVRLSRSLARHHESPVASYKGTGGHAYRKTCDEEEQQAFS